MSVAIRKKSWEEHVSQWMGLALEAVQCNSACRHGLAADNLQSSMEQDEALGADREEERASFPECCYSRELRGCPAKQLGSASKELDENDNHEGEGQLLEASTETLVHVSDGDDDYSALNLEGVSYHHTAATGKEHQGEEKRLDGAASSPQVPPITESTKAAEASELVG
ncbi:Rho GTPase-activating protein 7, partial [Dryobates pubescens]